jgi:hypothetical protein
MIVLISFFKKFKLPLNKPKFCLEKTFELDPIDLIKDFRYKFKCLDGDNWVIDSNMSNTFFDKLFHNQITAGFTEIDIVWNTDKLKIKRAFGIIEGFNAEIFHFIYEKNRILKFYLIKDYGKSFENWKANFQSLSSEIQIPIEYPLGFIQNKHGNGLLLEKFGHTQIWVVENWFLVSKTILTRKMTI